MDTKIRTWLAEMVGTYLVVLAGAGTYCAAYLTGDTPFRTLGDVLGVALATGLALAVAVTVCVPLSVAACNPAITLALWVTRKLELGQALLLGGVQLLGGFLAGLSLRLMFTDAVLAPARMGVPRLGALLPADGTLSFGSIAAGVSLEALFTFLITLAVYSTLIDPRGPRLGGLLVGLAQVVAVLFGFHLTGGAANPARYFGPALWQLSVPSIERPLAEHAVYWAGPLAGALAGCIFYTSVLTPPETKK
jgi:glycerol uptake facilitator-like aquaporin